MWSHRRQIGLRRTGDDWKTMRAKFRQHLHHQMRIRVTRFVKIRHNMRGILGLALSLGLAPLGSASLEAKEVSDDLVLDSGFQSHAVAACLAKNFSTSSAYA